jgi:putative endonuclease
MARQFFAYIMTNNNNTVLYTGITNNIVRRVQEHKEGINPGFTDKYRVTKLVYYELSPTAESAILREKQLKGGPRKKKEELIESFNPEWRDLSDDLY